jgi:hypothetical protein
MKKYPYQNLPGLNNVEVEGGETVSLPDGRTFKFVGRKHNKGGIDVSVPEGSLIFSEKVELPKEVVKNLADMERKMSPAKLSKKYDTNTYAERLTDTSGRYDLLDKKTQELMLIKHQMMQENIFSAQEDFKKTKNFRSNGKSKRQTNGNSPGNFISNDNIGSAPDVIAQYGMEVGSLDIFKNPYGPPNIPFYQGQAPYQVAEGTPQLLLENLGAPLPAVQNNLLDPKYANTKLKGQNLQDYKEYQRFLTGDPTVFNKYGIDNSKIEGVKRLTALNWLEKQATQTPDKNITGKALINGRWEPLTKENVDQATDFNFPGFVDGLPGNGLPGRDYARTSNQPHVFYEQNPIETPGLNVDYGQPISEGYLPTLPKKKFIPLKSDLKSPKFFEPEEEPKGLDWQRIINGTELGLNALQMANIKVKNPYYQYQPSQLYYTRFEPINTKQQERAYNIAKESIENSNLPELVKKARLADMYAKTVEGINQIDITNAQGNLQNKNQNVQYAREVMNNDIQRRNQANYVYVQEQDRGQENAYNLRQELLGNSLGIWKEHVKNREEVDLINQNFRNFKYLQQGNRVNYLPGQGNNMNFNQLAPYSQFSRAKNQLPDGFDINDLSASGREKLLGQ